MQFYMFSFNIAAVLGQRQKVILAMPTDPNMAP
jgi:hypothetical protein